MPDTPIKPLHLIKLCVGCDAVADLEAWITACQHARRGGPFEQVHTTRMTPKRADELLAGGSLYWVIKGQIQCRQRLLALRPMVDAEGIGRCELVLEPKVVRTALRPMRAFQGWRYFTTADAPSDLDQIGEGVADMPEALRQELAGLGLI
ncbi:DUF1489 family protein [Blastochloris viridis]|uniref:DUF1489 family protein n=1 Tax=Blastochloris viridis TaxID=1079 RepID=A0A0H5BFB7_BLAVI|nr:DUF1489 domain-containing protein [Blastochloris viridis]ALK09235.1 hypothetical protein BVIR_1452 [Blastochloris viridis]BAS00896.1 hypothetical protein BV133_3302 [Blastochloris viridis]CUU41898.1 hypothetical protein BVIRIDIS_08970 [Blastochloris viridis]